MKEINQRAFQGIMWMGKAALFCFGLLAMLALVVVTTVLTAVMLAATILPATAVRQKRVLRDRRGSGNTAEFAAPRKAVVP